MAHNDDWYVAKTQDDGVIAKLQAQSIADRALIEKLGAALMYEETLHRGGKLYGSMGEALEAYRKWKAGDV